MMKNGVYIVVLMFSLSSCNDQKDEGMTVSSKRTESKELSQDTLTVDVSDVKSTIEKVKAKIPAFCNANFNSFDFWKVVRPAWVITGPDQRKNNALGEDKSILHQLNDTLFLSPVIHEGSISVNGNVYPWGDSLLNTVLIEKKLDTVFCLYASDGYNAGKPSHVRMVNVYNGEVIHTAQQSKVYLNKMTFNTEDTILISRARSLSCFSVETKKLKERKFDKPFRVDYLAPYSLVSFTDSVLLIDNQNLTTKLKVENLHARGVFEDKTGFYCIGKDSVLSLYNITGESVKRYRLRLIPRYGTVVAGNSCLYMIEDKELLKYALTGEISVLTDSIYRTPNSLSFKDGKLVTDLFPKGMAIFDQNDKLLLYDTCAYVEAQFIELEDYYLINSVSEGGISFIDILHKDGRAIAENYVEIYDEYYEGMPEPPVDSTKWLLMEYLYPIEGTNMFVERDFERRIFTAYRIEMPKTDFESN